MTGLLQQRSCRRRTKGRLVFRAASSSQRRGVTGRPTEPKTPPNSRLLIVG